jgi:hypothetical protein
MRGWAVEFAICEALELASLEQALECGGYLPLRQPYAARQGATRLSDWSAGLMDAQERDDLDIALVGLHAGERA